MILLKFGTEIKGNSVVDGHKDWITLTSVQLGVGRAITTVGGGTSRDTSNPSFSELTCSKDTDKASSDLYFQSIAGVSLQKAEIHWVQTGGTKKSPQVYLKIELNDPIVTSYSLSSGGERPNESFALNFTKITYQYDDFEGEKRTTGTPKKWNLMENKSF